VLLDRRAPMTTPLDSLSGLLDTAPTTRREFRAIDDVSAFARVYQTATQQPKAVTAVFRVLDGDLREISSTQVHLTAEQFTTAGSASADFRLPLDTLTPGSYVLRLDASVGSATGRRDLRFSVK